MYYVEVYSWKHGYWDTAMVFFFTKCTFIERPVRCKGGRECLGGPVGVLGSVWKVGSSASPLCSVDLSS